MLSEKRDENIIGSPFQGSRDVIEHAQFTITVLSDHRSWLLAIQEKQG